MSLSVNEQREIEKDFAALECLNRTRLMFERRICEASVSQDEKDVLSYLRLDKMFEFAEFFYTISAMGLSADGDISILADLHNDRIERLLKDERRLRNRGLNKDRLLNAIFTSDTRPRLEHIWRESPGTLDQSNLARFMVTQMSVETTRILIKASEKAGLLTRKDHITGAKVISSTGVMERVMGECLREARLAIARL